MGNKLDKLGRALRSSVNAYNESIATVEGTVLVRARRFRDLNVSERELISPAPVEEPVRQIQAPELVEDAVAVDTIVDRETRARRRRLAIPERDELVRPDPDLLELVIDAEPGDSDQRRTS
jgi:DNA recombination protein RmuC